MVLMSTRICEVEDCVNPHLAKGYCRKHYGRWQTHGDPLVVLPRGGQPGPRSEETKAKISRTMKENGPWWEQEGVEHPATGAVASTERRERISSALQGNQNAKGHQNALGKTWTLTDEQREARKGPRPSMYVDDPGYQAVHQWMRRHHPSTGVCEACSETRTTYWSNISGEYRRERDDFWELCVPCHKLFDYLKRIDDADPALVGVLRAKRGM